MTTLTDVLQQVYIALGQTDSFVATGGSTTTTVNTSFANEAEPPDEDRFVRNYVLVQTDAGGANAAPEGEWGLVSAYSTSTYTITHGTLSSAVGSGDTILLLKQSNFPLLEVIDAINRGLRKCGLLYYVDETLTSADSQTEYSLPAGVMELLDVKIQVNDDSNDNDWTSIPGCYIIGQTSAMSSEPLIYIPQQPSGYTIQLHYKRYHPIVSAYDSVINKFIPLELAVAASKVSLLEGYISSKGGNSKDFWGTAYSEALRQFNEATVMYPMIRPKRKKKHGLLWQDA